MNQLYEHCCPEDTKTATGCSSFTVGYNLLLLDKGLSIDETNFYTEEYFQNSPNLKIKVSNKDAIVILWRRTAIPWHGTAILWHGITILCFNTNNASRNDKLYNLIKNTFLPVRGQKISG